MAEATIWDQLGRGLPELRPVGEFVVPPEGALQRESQALHVDFGLPILMATPVDVARFTALYIDVDQPASEAATRIVVLRSLLEQRTWPSREVIAKRLRRSADSGRPVEGILGRIIEAVDESTTLVPTTTPGFLCGMEFASLEEENSYLRSAGMDLVAVEQRIVLRSGEALLVDNLTTAHGRLGRRRTNEVHQLFVGYQSLDQDLQRILLDRILCAFSEV